jgi:rRNA maturation protein Nop10
MVLTCPGGVRLKTPLHIQAHGIKPLLPSKKLWRAPLSYCGPFKKEFISSWWLLEAKGALAQIGDPGKVVDRVAHAELAAIFSVTRETITKRLGKFAAPDPEWDENALCKCHGRPRRQCHSEKLSAIAANHPHWQKSSSGADRPQRSSAGQVSPVAGDYENSSPALPAGDPDKMAAALHGEGCRRARKDGARAEKHVAAILARNRGFRVANSYALACDDGLRPSISAGANQVGFLAHTFGPHLFSREQQGWLDPRQSLDGFRKSYGWMWDANLPDAPDCACVTGQLKLAFQEVCPRCGGAGFVIGGTMPDYGRLLLHWLLDRGIDEELRRCAKCTRTFAGNHMCPGCGARGEVFKKRGELNGPGSAKYTMEDIAAGTGLHVSTVYRYFTTFKRLNIIRTAKGDVWRKCQKCTNLPLYCDKCPGCGSTSDPIKRSDPQLIIFTASRTLDKEMARGELARLDALVKWHRRWLDKKHQADLEAAVDLAKKVLGEWEGHEYLLVSFYNEMRRRLAHSKLRANLVEVLFPCQRE